MKDTKVIFVGNYKGGVGKTTSVLNFAEHFAKQGKRVLVLDLDPQSSLSEILVNNSDVGDSLADLSPSLTLNYVYDLYISKIKQYNSLELKFNEDIIQQYKKGFDFVASSLFYNGGIGLDELAIRMEDNIEYMSILKNFIDSIKQKREYDFIIMDCPPSNNLITRSAFLTSQYYIIPTILDGISTNGVAHYINTVSKIYEKYCKESADATIAKHYFGEKSKLIGIFCTFIRGQVYYDNERKNLMKTLKDRCNEENIYFFDENINNYVDIARSTAVGEASKARNDYQELTKSVLKRISEL